MVNAGGVGARLSFVAETVSKAATGAAASVTQTPMQVDLEQAPKLIAGLTEAIEKLQVAYEKSEALRSIQSPGKDPYSGFATIAIRKSAGDQEGGYGWANKEARKALGKTIENIEKALETYRQTDDAARDALKPKE